MKRTIQISPIQTLEITFPDTVPASAADAYMVLDTVVTRRIIDHLTKVDDETFTIPAANGDIWRITRTSPNFTLKKGASREHPEWVGRNGRKQIYGKTVQELANRLAVT